MIFIVKQHIQRFVLLNKDLLNPFWNLYRVKSMGYTLFLSSKNKKQLRNSEPSNPGWAKKLWALKLVDGFLKKKKCNHEDNIDKGVSLENPYFSPKYVE